MGSWKRWVALAAALLPQRAKLTVYRRLLGWQIAPDAVIKRSLILVDELHVGSGAFIGNLNVIKGARLVEIGDHAFVGHFNWITAEPVRGPKLRHAERDPVLRLHHHAVITNRHFIDCGDTVEIGPFAALAGMRTTILTHTVDVARVRQQTRPVRIGERSVVWTHCVLLPGVRIPSFSMVRPGSVVMRPFAREYRAYGGVPAKPLGELPHDLAFWARTETVVA